MIAAGELGWNIPAACPVRFLRPLGGFVGSDILAGIVACGIPESDGLVALLDLGTNGEVSLGNKQRILCASTAAGPAFEAACISCGMRATTGAISRVFAAGGEYSVRVIGNTAPLGICGSGLLDAAAAALNEGWLLPRGRIVDSSRELRLAPGVALTQEDIRELQLAKAAVASGLRLLLKRWGAELSDLKTVFLGGAFGNYLDVESAHRIGLLETVPSIVVPSGNTALGEPGWRCCPSISNLLRQSIMSRWRVNRVSKTRLLTVFRSLQGLLRALIPSGCEINNLLSNVRGAICSSE